MDSPGRALKYRGVLGSVMRRKSKAAALPWDSSLGRESRLQTPAIFGILLLLAVSSLASNTSNASRISGSHAVPFDGGNITSGNATAGNNSTDPIAATYPQHWKQGAIYSAMHLAFWATEVQTTITVPENNPYSGDYTFIGLSVWGTGTSYDQIGIYDQPSGWEILTGWSSGCASQTYHDTGVQPFPGMYLWPNTQYTFSLKAFGNGTIEEAMSLGTTTSFQMWATWYNTGDNSFQMGSVYTCGSWPNQHSYDDYTVYEEIGVTGSYKGTTGEDVPNWDYTFTGNSWVVSLGCGCGSWSSYQVGGGPSYTSTTIATNGNSITNNQDGNVTIGTTLGSGTLAYLSATPGTHLIVPGNMYQTCCSGGGTASLSVMGLPTGWTATFTPSASTPSFPYSLDLWIPSTAIYGSHWLQVNASWGSGLWTTALFYVYSWNRQPRRGRLHRMGNVHSYSIWSCSDPRHRPRHLCR